MKATRKEVYAVIDGERAYQDRRWPGHVHTVTEWLVFIDVYLQEAKRRVTFDEGEAGGLDALRKIASMAVCCMEENGVIPRTIV